MANNDSPLEYINGLCPVLAKLKTSKQPIAPVPNIPTRNQPPTVHSIPG